MPDDEPVIRTDLSAKKLDVLIRRQHIRR